MSCACATIRARHAFDCIEDAALGEESRALLEGCELVVALDAKWMSLHRCRACGALWVEAYLSSGHMELQHFYPLPATAAEPEAWLREHGAPLPRA